MLILVTSFAANCHLILEIVKCITGWNFADGSSRRKWQQVWQVLGRYDLLNMIEALFSKPKVKVSLSMKKKKTND